MQSTSIHLSNEDTQIITARRNGETSSLFAIRIGSDAQLNGLHLILDEGDARRLADAIMAAVVDQPRLSKDQGVLL